MIIIQNKANSLTRDRILGFANYGNIKNSLWILLLAVLICSSDALAKREGPTNIQFEIRFFRTIVLAIPVHLIGIFITKLINPNFYLGKRYRFIKYVALSSLICGLVTATDSLNDELWNPGTGVFVYLVFSVSFIAFRMRYQKGAFWAIGAAFATFTILIIPSYVAGMFVQQIILNAGIKLAW